jgi:hypothetical protein
MRLTSAEHRAALAEHRQRRNAAARARRAAPPQLIRVQDGQGQLLIAVSRSAPGVGYLLRPGPDGRLTCTCHAFRWRGTCAHVDAAELHQKGAA